MEIFNVEVRVMLKKGMTDAEGDTVQKSLALLGFKVQKVDTIKTYVLHVEAASKEAAVAEVRRACEKLIANPVIHDFKVTVLS
ncbi:Phosphoribosylformylglycinamidine synthase subunit PurS [uncultured archaeon]|nr:Phosphoribosylformylglycinamidine synthase subunit PurS [uncultured archaeon]